MTYLVLLAFVIIVATLAPPFGADTRRTELLRSRRF